MVVFVCCCMCVFVTLGVCVCMCVCVVVLYVILSVMLVWLHFMRNKLSIGFARIFQWEILVSRSLGFKIGDRVVAYSVFLLSGRLRLLRFNVA